MPGWRTRLADGALAGLAGGATIWIYEAVVWSRIQHRLPLTAIPANAVGLTLGAAAPARLGLAAPLVGSAIHFGFAAAWGMAFALCWPTLRRRGCEASLAAVMFAPLLWLVMHAAIVVIGARHPDYADPDEVIGGVMSHLFYTLPMALLVKRRA